MPHPPNRLNVVRLTRGQTKTLLITVKDQDGRPAKLNQATDIRMTVRDHDGIVMFVRTMGDGIAVTDAAKGQAKIVISSDNSNIAVAHYRYDVWVTYAGMPPVRDPVVKSSEFIVTESVTSFS